MKLFPYYNKQISIPSNDSKTFNVIFMSENEDFLTAYPKLMIRRQFAKKLTIPPAKQPRLIVSMKNYIPYKKQLGLLPSPTITEGNTFIPLDDFLNKIELTYGKSSYRKISVLKRVSDYLASIAVSSDKKNILMYHVNLSKEVDKNFLNRRSIILALLLKNSNGAFPFNFVTLAIERDGQIKFFNIQAEGLTNMKDTRIYSILKSLVPKSKNIVADSITLEKFEISNDRKSILAAIAKYQSKKILKS